MRYLSPVRAALSRRGESCISAGEFYAAVPPMNHLSPYLVCFCCQFLAAGQLTADFSGERGGLLKPGDSPAVLGAPEEGTLPHEVQGFQGKVTGSVISVDAAKAEIRVKVTKAEPHAGNSKAPKPEALQGMTIVVTALEVRPNNGPPVPEEKAAAYIKGAQPGDAVILEVRTSSKGVVFRLLKVPSAAKK